MFRQLDADKIVATTARLRDRIRARFPVASLVSVAGELLVVARDHVRRSAAIARPDYRLRALSGLLVLGAVAAAVLVGLSVHVQRETEWRLGDLVQAIDSGVELLFLLGAGAVLLLSLEHRAKRRRCLHAIHEMRAMAHIVDLHQMAKDPDRTLDLPADPAAAVGEGPLSPADRSHYLDYCSEMLSLIGKVSALYVQGFPDAQAMAAVDEVEHLTTSLSGKIWQKINILEQAAARP
ncbi:MAG TPA: hypothetical protein VK348_00480 [Planctomycetota bacterium]|nr:hypothetical protein [Planctomycetota bacterium]